MYAGGALGRVGLDFRAALPPLFESRILALFTQVWCSGVCEVGFVRERSLPRLVLGSSTAAAVCGPGRCLLGRVHSPFVTTLADGGSRVAMRGGRSCPLQIGQNLTWLASSNPGRADVTPCIIPDIMLCAVAVLWTLDWSPSVKRRQRLFCHAAACHNCVCY